MISNKTNPETLAAIKSHLKQHIDPLRPAEQIRKEMEGIPPGIRDLEDIHIEQVLIGYLRGEWVRAASSSEHRGSCAHADRVILYFHGGGFVGGTCLYYRDLASRISKESGVKVLTFEYRLAPEHPYPAANEDALYVYGWLKEQGYLSENIIFGGDSVGGSLALMTLLTLREQGEDLAAGAFLLSPHTDLLHLDGESYEKNQESDPTGSLKGNQRLIENYLGPWQGDPPQILSPLRMNLEGLPPLLIQAGGDEVLLSDAVRLSEKAEQAGVEVNLEIWDNMWSVFQFLASMLPEAQQALGKVGLFVRDTIGSKR